MRQRIAEYLERLARRISTPPPTLYEVARKALRSAAWARLDAMTDTEVRDLHELIERIYGNVDEAMRWRDSVTGRR